MNGGGELFTLIFQGAPTFLQNTRKQVIFLKKNKRTRIPLYVGPEVIHLN